jgi:hypothetical protein
MGEGQPAQGKPMGQANQNAQAGQPMQPMAGDATPTGKAGAAAAKGDTAQNEKAKDADLKLNNAPDADSRGEAGNREGEVAQAKLEKEPWFAKLPPRVQQAIQSKVRGKAPRGYEERLRRYFESVD